MIFSTFDTSTYKDDFRRVILRPGIWELKEASGNLNTLHVVLEQLFRQMDMWRHNYSCGPRQGMIPDPGITKEEAAEVYTLLDTIFADVFPNEDGTNREKMTLFMETLIRDVLDEVEGKKVKSRTPELLLFMEKLLEAIEWLEKKPKTSAVVAV